jgi:hypothetical protein
MLGATGRLAVEEQEDSGQDNLDLVRASFLSFFSCYERRY